jgi:hypothetical protein
LLTFFERDTGFEPATSSLGSTPVVQDAESLRDLALLALNGTTPSDTGRFEVTHLEKSQLRYRTPSVPRALADLAGALRAYPVEAASFVAFVVAG